MASKAQIKANIAYNRRQDSITIRPSKTEGAHIRAAAAEAGQSVQRFILDTLRARIGMPPDDEEGANDDNTTEN